MIGPIGFPSVWQRGGGGLVTTSDGSLLMRRSDGQIVSCGLRMAPQREESRISCKYFYDAVKSIQYILPKPYIYWWFFVPPVIMMPITTPDMKVIRDS